MRTNCSFRSAILLNLFALTLVFSGCSRINFGETISREKMTQIKAGMTEAQVKQILGEPDPKRVNVSTMPAPLNVTYTTYIYGSGNSIGSIFFENGKVVASKYNEEQLISDVKK